MPASRSRLGRLPAERELRLFAPSGELRDGCEVRATGIPIPDVGREELPERLPRSWARVKTVGTVHRRRLRHLRAGGWNRGVFLLRWAIGLCNTGGQF